MAQGPLVVTEDDLQPASKSMVVSEDDLKSGGKPPSIPAGQFLGDPTKKATIGRTPGVLEESLPMVGGALGGAAGAAIGSSTGPVGAATLGVAGAGFGGAVGRMIQQYITALTDKKPLPKFAEVAGNSGKEATSQMEMQMGGEMMAAPLGVLRRGGFLKFNAPTMAAVRENAALGTRLSGPELATGTPVGNIAKGIQSYSTGAFGGGEIQRGVREAGTKKAFQAIDDALATLGHPGVTGGPTATSKGSAYAARKFLGEQLDKAADQAPNVDVAALKDKAAQELQRGIVQHLKAVPDVADPKLAQVIRQLRSNPNMIQRLPRPVLTAVADAILDRFKSPSLQLLRRTMGMEDETAARGVWEELKALGGKARPTDELYSTSDQQRIATFLRGELRDALGKSAPEFGQALSQYRDLARGDFLRENIVLGGKPLPKNEEEANDILTGMATRLRKAAATGQLAREFGDPNGKQVVQNITQVANLMERRAPQMQGMLRKIFEIGRLMTIPAGVVTGHLPASTLTQATLWEGFPDFFTWVVHDPQATKWFIEGSNSKNPATSTAATIRLMELYRRTHQQQPQDSQPQ